jgi:hypothetical protein
MKRLLWLYPRAWRERYSAEMTVLVEDLPAGLDVAIDLLIGAGAAYASAIRGNRILNSAAAYLHGVCVAVLLQAIAFVSLVLISQRAESPTIVELGPIRFAMVTPQTAYYLRNLAQMMWSRTVTDLLPALALLAILAALLALVLVTPGWVRRRTA